MLLGGRAGAAAAAAAVRFISAAPLALVAFSAWGIAAEQKRALSASMHISGVTHSWNVGSESSRSIDRLWKKTEKASKHVMSSASFPVLLMPPSYSKPHEYGAPYTSRRTLSGTWAMECSCLTRGPMLRSRLLVRSVRATFSLAPRSCTRCFLSATLLRASCSPAFAASASCSARRLEASAARALFSLRSSSFATAARSFAAATSAARFSRAAAIATLCCLRRFLISSTSSSSFFLSARILAWASCAPSMCSFRALDGLVMLNLTILRMISWWRLWQHCFGSLRSFFSVMCATVSLLIGCSRSRSCRTAVVLSPKSSAITERLRLSSS